MKRKEMLLKQMIFGGAMALRRRLDSSLDAKVGRKILANITELKDGSVQILMAAISICVRCVSDGAFTVKRQELI